MKPAQKKKLLALFEELYPEPESELDFKNPFQLVVAVMLSAQCTDKLVNQVTPSLFKKYRSFKSLSAASLSDVETIIRPVNYYRTKAKHLIEMSEKVVKEFGNKLPETHAELTSLPGVGRKTANVVQSERGIEPALPVDTHVFRVSKRLGLATADKHDKVEEELKAGFAPELWRNLHHWLIFHGRRVCKAQRPQCAECTLRKLCPSAA